MKTNHFLSFLAIFTIALAFFACSSEPEPSPPPPSKPSSDSSGGQVVFCKLIAGTCSQISLSACMELVNAGTAQIVSSCNSEPPPAQTPSSSSSVPRSSSSLSGTSGTFTDSRDGKSYKWVKIGTQTWMAQNLNYDANGSKCYANSEASCSIYGRLYNWSMAKNICPSNWHLPSDVEWGTLMLYINPSCSLTGNCANVGKLLKSTSGWDSNGNGTDAYGFAALPNGEYNHDRAGFINIGKSSVWWTSSPEGNNNGYFRSINYDTEHTIRGSRYWQFFFAVRCLKD